MWIFGYGSLMWDGWEREYRCIRRQQATIHGYARKFNKPSIVRWGTRTNPGPTLNLAPNDEATCQGIAFEFPSEIDEAVRAYLSRREGRDFLLRAIPIVLANGENGIAHVPIFEGTVIKSKDPTAIAAMVVNASGTAGACADYVQHIDRSLQELGIQDQEVTLVSNAVKATRERLG